MFKPQLERPQVDRRFVKVLPPAGDQHETGQTEAERARERRKRHHLVLPKPTPEIACAALPRNGHAQRRAITFRSTSLCEAKSRLACRWSIPDWVKGDFRMSLMKTLARVAIGVAIAKGVGAVMQAGKSGGSIGGGTARTPSGGKLWRAELAGRIARPDDGGRPGRARGYHGPGPWRTGQAAGRRCGPRPGGWCLAAGPSGGLGDLLEQLAGGGAKKLAGGTRTAQSGGGLDDLAWANWQAVAWRPARRSCRGGRGRNRGTRAEEGRGAAEFRRVAEPVAAELMASPRFPRPRNRRRPQP